MKRILFTVLWAIARLCALLATLLGCSAPDAPDKPREIRWHGQETGYRGASAASPGDGADRDGQR